MPIICIVFSSNWAETILLLFSPDADLDYAADEIVNSRMGNTGQICCASKRFIVHISVADELIKKLVVRLDSLKRGDPIDPNTQLGCIINSDAAQVVMSQIQHTIDQGATCVYGNKLCYNTFVEPTILVNVSRGNGYCYGYGSVWTCYSLLSPTKQPTRQSKLPISLAMD